jgi:hypothetical protein
MDVETLKLFPNRAAVRMTATTSSLFANTVTAKLADEFGALPAW